MSQTHLCKVLHPSATERPQLQTWCFLDPTPGRVLVERRLGCLGIRYKRDPVLRRYKSGADGIYGRYRHRVPDVGGRCLTDLSSFPNRRVQVQGLSPSLPAPDGERRGGDVERFGMSEHVHSTSHGILIEFAVKARLRQELEACFFKEGRCRRGR